METIIAWTDYTFNPWMGCTKISAGCKNCYAETLVNYKMGLSLWGNYHPRRITKAPWNNLKKWALDETPGVLGKNNPKLVFCGSLMDFFEDRKELIEPRKKVYEIIKQNKNLHFQILTKRPENISDMLPADWDSGYSNVWLGCTIECQEYSERADILKKIPARIRFISYEPAIGPLKLNLKGIDWVIYGGESGPNRRPENKQWARDMEILCNEYKAAFFHKQSSALRTEEGILLDGKLIRNFPVIS